MVKSTEDLWGKFHGPNIGYVEEQYDLYLVDPEAVDPSLKTLFDEHGAPTWLSPVIGETEGAAPAATSIQDVQKLSSALKYVEAIRRFAHTKADVYPVGSIEGEAKSLEPSHYGLTEADLKNIPANWLVANVPAGLNNGLDIVNHLKELYTGKISFEYDYVSNDEERNWLQEQIESGNYKFNFSADKKKGLLNRLAQVEGFEAFLQKTFVGQKRFSIEGLEVMVPMLDKIVEQSAEESIENVMMGMAHRGRLSVLTHVLEKPFDKVFSEFNYGSGKEILPSESSREISYGWTGDVKYHFGAVNNVTTESGKTTKVTLAHNPSHLEVVNPVVEGFTRAAQDDRSTGGHSKQDVSKGVCVVVHGDAAFIGEGVVAETINLGGIEAYHTGGTLHIIANNLLGYTTTGREGRSTRYTSDLAKGYDIPVVHVNADDPIACLDAVKLAFEYRQKFNKDFLIDLVGYRRYGHNEMDEPRATQPLLYKEIDEHPTITKVYAENLQKENIIAEDDLSKMLKNVEDKLQAIYDSMEEVDLEVSTVDMPAELEESLDQFETAVPLEELKKINEDMLKRPEKFVGFKRLDRVFKKRATLFEDGQTADWGTGEALAFASILKDGTPIRLTGQDSERGTFAHRHMVLHDVNSGEKYCILHGLEDTNASFDIHNSALSEVGVLGFEYGYSVQAPETLVFWEAQFGDFANTAQVMFDQFLSSSRAKWGEKSNMVLLLPHGYEGQGPEHSSARLERFLQMSAENNWIVANVTSSAQLFHLLRRQAALKNTDLARPLVLMTPKSSLLRNERVASEMQEFAEGKFQALKDQPNLKVSKKNAKRLVIGSGKVMIDLEEAIINSEESFGWLRALRVEQLYPFPTEELAKELKALPNLEEIVWLQEEPQNMGPWTFVADYLRELLQDGQTLRYVGRPKRSAPSVGDPNVHKLYQNNIISEAIKPL